MKEIKVIRVSKGNQLLGQKIMIRNKTFGSKGIHRSNTKNNAKHTTRVPLQIKFAYATYGPQPSRKPTSALV